MSEQPPEPIRCPETFGLGQCARPIGHLGMHHGQRHAGWRECADCLWKMPVDTSIHKTGKDVDG